MRICLDISPAVHRRAGLGRYAQELTEALLYLDKENEYVAFYNGPRGVVPQPPLDRLPRLTVGLSNKPWRMSILLAHHLGLNLDRLFPGVDLLHSTDHLLPPLRRVRTVFTVHDLVFLFFPEYHLPLNRWYLTLMMPRFIRRADAVITVSECSRRDLVRLYRLDQARIHVIYEGIDDHFRPVEDREVLAAVRRQYGLPDGFILYVGTIEPRKNLTTLLKAYQTLKGQGLESKLVIVGKKGWLYQDFFRRLRELGLEGQVIFPGYVPDDDLPAIYSAAQVFAFPSLYEGFGLPPLEAMACGAPVVCSNTSSLPEVVGDAAILVNPRDVGEIVAAIERVIADSTLRDAMRAKGIAQAAKFSWERAARETLEVYANVQGV
ncbi:MAG: glycosyltransferase family 1 protein [Chloroflexota bacterium]